MAERMDPKHHHRVVVTGMGVITTVAEDIPTFFDALITGRSGITRWKNKDPRIDSKIGGDLSDFRFEGYLERQGYPYPAPMMDIARKLLRSTPLPGQLSVAAGLQAFIHAQLHTIPADPEMAGHVLAGHNLSNNYILHNATTFEETPEFIDPLVGLVGLDTDPLAVSSEVLGLKGPSFTIGAGCASSNMAVMAATDMIRAGRADVMLVSGVACDLDMVTLQSWASMHALAMDSFNDEPTRASRPFDAQREGFVPSQAAAAIVLERLPSAEARGAEIYAEILGAPAASSASRSPKSSLDGQVRSMTRALRDAGVEPQQVDYINAHATSTPAGDAVEVAAIKQVFGTHAYRIPVNATKSIMGHCLSASGMVELIATILQMNHNMLHPTINLENPDPALDLDFVPNHARPHDIGVAFKNAFGFGGLNSSVVLGNPKAMLRRFS